MAAIGTLKVKIEPEIDLSGLDDKFLDALADKIAERLMRQPVVAPLLPQPYRWPLGQVWC